MGYFYTRCIRLLLLFLVVLTHYTVHADTVYVWGYDGAVYKFATNGTKTVVASSVPGYQDPVCLTCDNVGNLYVGCSTLSTVWRYSPTGSSTVIASNFDVAGLAFDNTGQLFATIPFFNTIEKLDYGLSVYHLSTFNTHSNLSYPTAMAFDAAGNLYTVNSTNWDTFSHFPSPFDNTVQKFGPDLTPLGPVVTNLNHPSGIAFDSAGNLFVANLGAILKIATNGVSSTFANSANGISSPRGLGFDSSGNLYVANAGTILKFTPDGTGSIFASGLNSPTAIVIYPGLNVWSAKPVKLNPPTVLTNQLQFNFNENSGLSFTIRASSTLTSGWTDLGSAMEITPGNYQFVAPRPAGSVPRFYQITSP